MIKSECMNPQKGFLYDVTQNELFAKHHKKFVDI